METIDREGIFKIFCWNFKRLYWNKSSSKRGCKWTS